jgi:uncharacterized protein (TIGR02145 family)
MQKNLNQTIALLAIIGFGVLLATSCKKKAEDLSFSSLPDVTTYKATYVSLTTAQCGGNITSDKGYVIIQRGICYNTTSDPTINNFLTKEGDSSGEFISNLTGLNPGTKYYYKAYAINEKGTSYGSTYSFTTIPTTVNDVENNVYKVVQIGAQVWMAENLKTTKFNDNADIPLKEDYTVWNNLTSPAYCWCDNEKTTYKDIYGALYNWYTVNDGKLCPKGWHVPDATDWTTLENYLINNGYNYDGTTTGNKIAKALASITGWNSSLTTGAVGNTDYPAKRNVTGFGALPGGNRSSGGLFMESGDICVWWSSSEYNTNEAICRTMGYSHEYIERSNDSKSSGKSIRCVRD